jgi:hypothetical protein
MTLLSQIDWANHDGVNRTMINDFMRNQFYDNIFAGNVKDQNCIDIGFGTGLLSVLALKHGARSVVAYESDLARFELGNKIIKDLGLHQITLIHDRFKHDMIDYSSNLIFTETVNGNLWQEGLFQSLPRRPGIKFLPGQYFLEIYACVVPDVFAQGLIDPKTTQGFSPGVDIDQNFIELVNQIGFPGHSVSHPIASPVRALIDTGIDTEWGWIPYLRLCINNGTLVAGYHVDSNKQCINVVNQGEVPMNFGLKSFSITVNTEQWKNKSVILVPRAGMKHGDFKLMLDTGHWGATLSPLVLVRPDDGICITHNFYHGAITYTTKMANT